MSGSREEVSLFQLVLLRAVSQGSGEVEDFLVNICDRSRERIYPEGTTDRRQVL